MFNEKTFVICRFLRTVDINRITLLHSIGQANKPPSGVHGEVFCWGRHHQPEKWRFSVVFIQVELIKGFCHWCFILFAGVGGGD